MLLAVFVDLPPDLDAFGSYRDVPGRQMRQRAEQRASDELFASRQGAVKIKGPCVTVQGLLGLHDVVTVNDSCFASKMGEGTVLLK